MMLSITYLLLHYVPIGQDALDRLRSLDLTVEDLVEPLWGAAAEARTCSDLDAPGAPGYFFWTRCNRYMRERKISENWEWSNKDSILRCIHPFAKFSITATSATGGVGDEQQPVRGRNEVTNT